MNHLTRWITAALALLSIVLVFTLVLNSGSPQPPAAPGAGPLTSSQPSAVQPKPLVNRMLADLRAGRKPEQQQDKPLAGAPVKVVRAGPSNPAPIAELRIPALDLRTPVFEGVYEDAIVNGPGHWPGTPGLGEPGNTVLSGHRSTNTRPFLYLDRLTRGDVITIEQGAEQFRYAVDTVTIVAQRGYVPYVLTQPKDPRARTVTLFACNPLTAHYQRIVVRGHALKDRGTA